MIILERYHENLCVPTCIVCNNDMEPGDMWCAKFKDDDPYVTMCLDCSEDTPGGEDDMGWLLLEKTQETYRVHV